MSALQPSATNVPVAFRAFRQFNEPSWRARAGVDYRLDGDSAAWFPSTSRADQLARAIATLEAFPVKELVESFEFFERVRHRLRAPHVADLCCGHGLVGLLFAIFEREVVTVTLLDSKMPPLFPRLWEVICAFAPWVRAKVRYLETRLTQANQLLPAQVLLPSMRVVSEQTDAWKLRFRWGAKWHSSLAAMGKPARRLLSRYASSWG